ncbi:SH3 domain-containing protein [Streptomyces sp. HMX87]|uniref:SH3 domain-containing protein n=1 Tax=Streptomyces sp. HMX87 TaxID=3390849 RepID=UPI003A8473C6
MTPVRPRQGVIRGRPGRWRALTVLWVLLAGMCLPASPAAAEPGAGGSWRIDLSSTRTDQRNISHGPGGLITVRDRKLRTASAAEDSFAVYTAPPRSLGRLLSVFTVATEAAVPARSRLLVEVRGSDHPDTWTEWREVRDAGTVGLPRPVSVLQVRLTLFGDPEGEAPTVSGLVVGAAPEQPARSPDAGVTAAAGATYRLFATREGLVGHTTANGHVIQPRDHFVALPSRRMLASRNGHEYRVRLCYKGRCETAPVWDVGPWNTRDDYWNPPDRREMWRDLPQGTPQAQAAYQSGYNGGLDEFGRRVANPAGIDVADGTFWDGLGMTDNDWVDVTFQPDDGAGGTTTVTAWADANVRSCASTTCSDLSDVHAGQSYPANCWVMGQLVQAEGYTNDKWVQLPLRSGGVGYVSAIYLKGDATGGVTRQC